MTSFEKDSHGREVGLTVKNRFIWLASWPKSGNTWVRAFLSAYQTGNLNINSMAKVNGDLNPYMYQAAMSKPIPCADDLDIVLHRNASLCNLLELNGQRNVIIKTHHCNGECEGIRLIPECMTKKALYVVRDPRDVMVSYAKHMQLSFEDATAAICNEHQKIVHDDGLFHMVSSWSNHVQSWVSSEHFQTGVVHYEKLLADPQAEFRGILKFCELEFDQDRFDRALELSQFDNMKKQEQEKGFLETPNGVDTFFTHGRAGNWSDVPAKLIEQIEKSNMEMMQMFGYLERKAA